MDVYVPISGRGVFGHVCTHTPGVGYLQLIQTSGPPMDGYPVEHPMDGWLDGVLHLHTRGA